MLVITCITLIKFIGSNFELKRFGDIGMDSISVGWIFIGAQKTTSFHLSKQREADLFSSFSNHQISGHYFFVVLNPPNGYWKSKHQLNHKIVSKTFLDNFIATWKIHECYKISLAFHILSDSVNRNGNNSRRQDLKNSNQRN